MWGGGGEEAGRAASVGRLSVLPAFSTSFLKVLLFSAHFQSGPEASHPFQELLHLPTHEEW